MTNEDLRKISAHDGLGSLPNRLDELWLEIGGSCHLKCDYCFAESGGIDRDPDNISIERILELVKEFDRIGGTRIGVVGAGEPFHSRNRKDLFNILDYTESHGITTSIFTTGDLLSDRLLDNLDNYQNITLLIKYNSQDNQTQDNLVHLKGYTQRRDEAMARLIERGYNDGKRLGIVTSIMKDNQDEMSNLLRYARKNNLIFDADTLIPRGRGGTCNLRLTDEKTKAVLRELQRIDREEYGNTWEITGSYVGSPPCTRFNQHLYIDKKGIVHPCVSSTGVVLGDARTESLSEIWEKEITKIIRDHHYVGKCVDSCKNYEEQKCYSCLGRATEDLNTESLLKNGCVKTVGCFNFKPKEK